MTHRELCTLAVQWLVKRQQCVIAGAEFHHQAVIEKPDALGWTYRGTSYLIECKTSRTDFKRDARKAFRVPGAGVGTYRFFATPEGLITTEEVPEGWGLLETSPRGGLRIIKHAVAHPTNWVAERAFLIGLVRYVGDPIYEETHDLAVDRPITYAMRQAERKQRKAARGKR